MFHELLLSMNLHKVNVFVYHQKFYLLFTSDITYRYTSCATCALCYLPFMCRRSLIRFDETFPPTSLKDISLFCDGREGFTFDVLSFQSLHNDALATTSILFTTSSSMLHRPRIYCIWLLLLLRNVIAKKKKEVLSVVTILQLPLPHTSARTDSVLEFMYIFIFHISPKEAETAQRSKHCLLVNETVRFFEK